MRRWGERALKGSAGNGWLVLVASAALAAASLPAGQAVPVAGPTASGDTETLVVGLPVVELPVAELPVVEPTGTEPPLPHEQVAEPPTRQPPDTEPLIAVPPPDPETLVAQLLGAEPTAADLAVFETPHSIVHGGTCSLDTPESVRQAAVYHRHLADMVDLEEVADARTLAAVVRLLRDEYDAVASGVQLVPLPDEHAALAETVFESEVPLSAYTDALRGMLEPYGVRVFVPNPGDPTKKERFLPLTLDTPDSLLQAKFTVLTIMEGFATLPVDAIRAVDFDVYIGDVLATFDGVNEAGGYAWTADDGRGIMALDGTGGIQPTVVPHEWTHLLDDTCDPHRRGDTYFDAFYPPPLPSTWASDILATQLREMNDREDGDPPVLPTVELAHQYATTIENFRVLDEIPYNVTVAELTNYALRKGEGFPVHMEVITSPPWAGTHLEVGSLPATDYLQGHSPIINHLAVTAARLERVAPGAGEMGVLAIMVRVLCKHLWMRATWDSSTDGLLLSANQCRVPPRRILDLLNRVLTAGLGPGAVEVTPCSAAPPRCR